MWPQEQACCPEPDCPTLSSQGRETPTVKAQCALLTDSRGRGGWDTGTGPRRAGGQRTRGPGVLLLWLRMAPTFNTTHSPTFFYMDDCWRSFSKIVLMIKDATSRPAVKECTSDGRPSLSSVLGRRFARPGGGEEGLRKQWGSTSCKTENLKVWSPSISADNSGWCWPVTGSVPHAFVYLHVGQAPGWWVVVLIGINTDPSFGALTLC